MRSSYDLERHGLNYILKDNNLYILLLSENAATSQTRKTIFRYGDTSFLGQFFLKNATRQTRRVINIDTKTNKSIEFYSQYVNYFVVAERKNGKKAVGVLTGVSPDGKLAIKGKYMFWALDPEEIIDFSARPDKVRGGDPE